MSKLLIIENCDFEKFPTGGTLTFAKQLISELPSERIALVGITTENLKIGKWTKQYINGKTYDFFPILRLNPKSGKPFIPLRIKTFSALIFYLFKIRKISENYVFTQTPQFLFALSLFKWESICFCFAGLGNSVKLSRYKKLRFFGGMYEKILLFLVNKKVDCILAAADANSILKFKQYNKAFFKKDIISFPTRFDSKIFYPKDKHVIRKLLKLPMDKTILITTGRLCWVKGWDLLLEVISLRAHQDLNFILIFVGDGEDKDQIIEKYPQLYNNVFFITGFVNQNVLVNYINASDVFLLGSYIEGWSTSLIEALACGKPIVTTEVSSAREIVFEDKTGYIVQNRDPKLFNECIDKALKLETVLAISTKMSEKYRKDNLKRDLIKNWPKISSVLQ